MNLGISDITSIIQAVAMVIGTIYAALTFHRLLAGAKSTPISSADPRATVIGKSVNIRRVVVIISTLVVLGWVAAAFTYLTRPMTQTVQGYTKTELDDYAAKKVDAATKPLKQQLDQANNELETLRRSGVDMTKVVAGLRAQIAQLQSDTPISVDKLPTSMRVSFNGTDTVIRTDDKNIAAWTPILEWHDQPFLLRQTPVLALILVFKKPVTFDEIYVEDVGTGTSITVDTVMDSHFAVVQFSTRYMNGLVDIIARKKRAK